MKKANCQRNEGYQQDFYVGQRIGGKINKRDVENLFKTETQHLSYEESLDYKWDWHDGSTNSANQVIESLDLQKKENYPIEHIVIHFCAGIILWSIFIKFIF
jgi:hypothetical protein